MWIRAVIGELCFFSDLCFFQPFFSRFSWYYHDKKLSISRFFTKLSATPRSHRGIYFFVFCWSCARLGSHRVIYFFTFWSSFGSILGSGRSQRSICLSTFETRNEHVRETPKNTESLKYSAYRPLTRTRQKGVPKSELHMITWLFCRQMGAAHPKAPPDAHSASGPGSTSRRRRDHAGLGEPNNILKSPILF